MHNVSFRGRPFGNVPRNTSLNSSASSFNYPRTPESTLDRISSSRSSTLRRHFFGSDFSIMSRIFPFVSPNDSVFTATLTFLFSYPHTTARKIGVLFFTSLFNCSTEVNLSLPGRDVPLAKNPSTGTAQQRLFLVLKVVLHAVVVISEVLRLSTKSHCSRCCRHISTPGTAWTFPQSFFCIC